MSHTRHFVLQIRETIRTGIQSNYSNTQNAKEKNKNQTLVGVEKILIPNRNSTIRSAAIQFCIQNIVLYTEFFENGSVMVLYLPKNVVNGSIYARKYLFEYK